jgi:hypothetical protein
VIPPAKTGKERIRRMAVKKTVHTKRGRDSHPILTKRKFKIVQRKLIEPPIEEAPAT